MADDRYASIRTIPSAYFAKKATTEKRYRSEGSGESESQFWDDVAGPEQWSHTDGSDWDRLLASGGFQSKYNSVSHLDDNTVKVTLQQPGAHKYDTMDAIYRRDAVTGDWGLQNDPSAAPSRQVSTGESFVRDPLEQFGKDFVLPSVAMYFGAQGLNSLMAAPTAGGGTAAVGAEAATVGAGTGGSAAGGNMALLESSLGTAGYGASSAGAGGAAAAGAGGLLAPTSYAPATNAALAESAAGTAGYGASSAGAGGGAGQLSGGLSGLLDNPALSKVGNGLLDYIKQNPRVVGGLLGAGAGASGGLDGGGGEQPYTGAMPTISRGGWQPRVQATQMQVPTFGQGLRAGNGVPGSGLWRFNRGG